MLRLGPDVEVLEDLLMRSVKDCNLRKSGAQTARASSVIRQIEPLDYDETSSFAVRVPFVRKPADLADRVSMELDRKL
jgi:hypothetical protein